MNLNVENTLPMTWTLVNMIISIHGKVARLFASLSNTAANDKARPISNANARTTDIAILLPTLKNCIAWKKLIAATSKYRNRNPQMNTLYNNFWFILFFVFFRFLNNDRHLLIVKLIVLILIYINILIKVFYFLIKLLIDTEKAVIRSLE